MKKQRLKNKLQRSNLSLFGWFLLSVFFLAFLWFLYQNSNLIQEIQVQENSNNQRIQNLIENLKQQNSIKPLSTQSVHSEKNGNFSLNQDKNIESPKKFYPSEETDSNSILTTPSQLNPAGTTLFYCKLTDHHVEIVPLLVSSFTDVTEKITETISEKILENRKTQIQNSIPWIIQKLKTPPVGYQSLIPMEVHLLDHHLDQALLTLNLSENFLNDSVTELGKHLKISQIVASMTALNGIDAVQFEIEGKKLPFLDRDGLVSNQIFKKEDILMEISLD